MEIVAGSYEEVLLGLRFDQEADEHQLTERFTEKAIGSIRCVAISDDGLLASGGTDEIIRIFDLKKQRLMGTLTHHSGTVTSLQFHDTHLFSTSEDGTLCLWRVTSWEPERTFKGHKGPVKHVAVHPSGKITLTVGQDKTLRLWNNMTGRIAYISNLKEAAELVSWSPGGLYYVISYRAHLEVFSLESKGLVSSIATSQKVNSIVFVSDTAIAYGGEGKIRDGEREKASLFFTDILEGNSLLQMETECDRIRGVAVWDKWMTVVGSDGRVSVYQFTTPSQESITVELVASRKISLRLTSVAMCIPKPREKKRKLKAAKESDQSPVTKKQKENKGNMEMTEEPAQSPQTKKMKIQKEKKRKLKKMEEADQSPLTKTTKKLKEKKRKLKMTEDPGRSPQAKKIKKKKTKTPT